MLMFNVNDLSGRALIVHDLPCWISLFFATHFVTVEEEEEEEMRGSRQGGAES